MHDHVHEDEESAEDVDHHEQAHSVFLPKSSPALERQDGDGEADDEHCYRADSQQPDGERGAVFVELKTDEAVDH